jgi:hypothetical protein
MIDYQSIHQSVQAALDRQDPNREGWAQPDTANKIADRVCGLLEIDEDHCAKCGGLYAIHTPGEGCGEDIGDQEITPARFAAIFWRAVIEVMDVAEDLSHVERTLLESLSFDCEDRDPADRTDLVFVRFECGQQDRIGPVMGPYEFVQFTYDSVSGYAPGKPDDEIHLGVLDTDRDWKTGDGQIWSDIVIGTYTRNQITGAKGARP